MESVRQTEKKYCSGAMTVAIVVGFLLILMGYKPLGKGLILGTVFSVVNFVLIGETLPLRIGQSRNKTFAVALGSIVFRYLLLMIPLAVALKFNQFNLFATIFGIFMIQFVILTDSLSGLIPTRKKQF